MLDIRLLNKKEAQNIKAFLAEQKNLGNTSIDSVLTELERLIEARHTGMSPEALMRARANKAKSQKRRDFPVTKIVYNNVCPECMRGELYHKVMKWDGVVYDLITCRRIVNGRESEGCGYSRMVK